MKKLEWDSEFFNKSIYEINLDSSNSFNLLEFADIIYVKSENDFDLKIEGFEKTFEENKIDFTKELIDIKNNVLNVHSIYDNFLSEEIKENLYNLAYISGENSRFLLDKNFGIKNFKNLYKKWIDNSLNKIIADEFFIYELNNEIKGFITVSFKDGIGKAGLLAVDPKIQGQGIGSKLLSKVENYLIENNINKLLIPTQLKNIKACNFYKKSGYEINTNLFIKHYWRNDTI